MATSSVSLSKKLAATLTEALANLELVNKDLDHKWKLLGAEGAQVSDLALELEALEQARREAKKAARLDKKARLLAESGLQEDDAPVSNEAMRELENAKKQLNLDRSNFEKFKFQLEVMQAQLGEKDTISIEDMCLMIPARNLNIICGDKPDHWKWTSIPDTKYAVAELLEVRWYHFYGRLDVSCLFPYTTYAAYFIFKLTGDNFGFEFSPAEAGVGIPDYGNGYVVINIFLVAEEDQAGPERAHEYPKRRADGWMEVELGTVFVRGDEDCEVQMSFLEIWGRNLRKGLIILGMELRPIPNEMCYPEENVRDSPQPFTRCWKA